MSIVEADSVIRYGDVIQLFTRSANNEGEGGLIGFMGDKTGKHQLLVVPPVEGAEFVPGEFIIAPTNDEKPPSYSTPLNYKKPFVLRTTTSDSEIEYSVNNKTPQMNDVVSLQPVGVKGEMYISFEKEGYTGDTNVHDGDMNVVINVVSSNRIRTNYNKPLGHFVKPKTNAVGGFVSSGSKCQPLTFKICKLAGATETHKYVTSPARRSSSVRWARRESLGDDAAKADELNQPEVVDENPIEDVNKVAADAATPATNQEADGTEKPTEAPSSQLSPASSDSTIGSTVSTAPSAPAPVDTNDTNDINVEVIADAVETELQSSSVDAPPATQTPSTLTTIAIDSHVAADVEPVPSEVVVVDKLTAVPTNVSSATVASDGETVEQVEMGCIGKCSIM